MTELLDSTNFKLEYGAGSVTIHIPGKRNAGQLSLLSAWLLFWFLILMWLFVIGYQVITGASKGRVFDLSALCILLPLTFAILTWGGYGIFGMSAFFWQIAGLETLEVSRDALRIRKTIFGIGQTNVYERDRITDIRPGTETAMPFAFLKFKFAMFQVPMFGPIRVSVKSKTRDVTMQLGLGLNSQEAERVTAIMNRQLFPSIAFGDKLTF